MTRFILLCLGLVPLYGCGALFAFVVQFAPQNRYSMNEAYEHAKFTNFAIKTEGKTRDGIKYDSSGYQIDTNKIDALVRELEQCTGMSIDRRAFIVKIAPGSTFLECADREIFACKLPEFEPSRCADPACPCGCSGILQWPNVVVTTPNLASLKHELVHLITRSISHDHQAFSCS